MTTGTPQFQMLPLADLDLSTTPAQAERRKRFDPAALAELAGSIRELGVQQPIIVRRVFKNGDLRPSAYQVVAGERRVLASQQAKLTEIPAMVREYTDQQVLEVQLIENLQREGLHELDEAEGYDALMKQHRFTVEDLVTKVGKSLAYVYARIKLLKLCPEVRKAFSANKLNASVALEIARIPVHDLQRKLLKEIESQQMSFREVKEHIHRHYRLRLDQAPFDTADAELFAKAGPCGTCPKRTGNQPELFGDVKSADVCTDPVCFESKTVAFRKIQIAEARADGREVFDGAAAKKLMPYGQLMSSSGYVEADQTCWDDPKGRKYGAIVGKAVKPDFIVRQQSTYSEDAGSLIPVFKLSTIRPILKERGAVKQPSKSNGSGGDTGRSLKAEKEKREIEVGARKRIARLVLANAPKVAGRDEFMLLLSAFSREGELTHELMGWDEPKGKSWDRYDKDLQARLPRLAPAELLKLAMAAALSDSVGNGYRKATELEAIAKAYKVDAAKERKAHAAEHAKAKPAAAKKPAQGKR